VTYFVYDEAGHLLGEYGGSGALIQETVWMADTPVATLRPRTGGGVDIYYVHTDHLNTPRKITRPADNALLWRWDVAPFGAALPDENPEGAGTFRYNLRFAGQYYDTESGLHYNYFREYDPAVGRYVESDPIGLKGGINTYGYANQDPVDLADPFGLNPYIWPILKPILENTLPKTDDCKTSEWNYCRARCGPARVLGCYVSLSWKLKGIRGGEPIRSEQRTVNCNCEELSCPGPGPKKKGSRSTYDTSLPLPLFPWWELIPVL
jgi:RHS repeat-associated protein